MTGRDDSRIRIRASKAMHRGWQTLTVYTVDVARQDGSVQTIVREVADHGSSVAVLPYDPERKTVLLTRQFRLAAHLNGHEGHLLEACAGMIDEGESPEDAVAREANEEMGVRLHDLKQIVGVFVSPGASQEHATLFSARYAPGDRVSKGGGVDAGEDIEIVEMPLAQAARGIAERTIVDAKTVILIQAALLGAGAG